MFGNSEPLDLQTARLVREFAERIEAKHRVRDEIAAEIATIYAEAKDCGIDGKALKAVIRMRKLNPEEREREQAIINAYLRAAGYSASTQGTPDDLLRDPDDIGFPSDLNDALRRAA